MTTTTFEDFKVKEFSRSPGMNLPQRLGARLWAPMWLMSLMGFAVGFILAIGRAYAIATGGAASTVLAVRHVQAGFMFIGFASVLAAISFAVARILGRFREGGSSVQEAAGNRVQVLEMPGMAKVFIVGMMMAMMAILIAVVLHFVVAASVASGSVSPTAGTQTFDVLEGVRRLGVVIYLLSIAFGLGSIITVLRYQTGRIKTLSRNI